MDWERAKNYILVFFLLLNIALGIMLAIENRRYVMTGDQERLIRTVLNRNNIGMYTIPIRRFPPMRPLEVTGFYYNQEELKQILFENPDAVEREEHAWRSIFRYGDSRLEISNGFIEYRNPNGFRQRGSATILLQLANEVTYAAAVRLTDMFINSYYPDFIFDGYRLGEDEIRIIYRQQYRGILVHSNSIEFLVTPVGIREIEMQFGQIRGYVAEPMAIFSPDEALLAFAQRVRHITEERPIHINRIDLVYFQSYISDQFGPYHAVPFYRIFTQCEDEPFLINAVTNVVFD
ncbi:MAG: hypothetical protein FWC32_04275 [Firmicutes bacterium]|nr:hypothetical protein [Bacillota bacterium]